MKPLRILLAEDDATYREELSDRLQAEPGVRNVTAVTNGQEALNTAATQFIDVALLDIDMPILDGIATARQMKTISPTTTIIILTAFAQESVFDDALALGIQGFLTKDLPSSRIYELVRDAHEGKTVMGPRPTEILATSYRQRLEVFDPEFTKAVQSLPEKLREVYDLIIQATPNKEIARRLRLSDLTVRTYVSQILTLTGCSSRSELAVKALTNSH